MKMVIGFPDSQHSPPRPQLPGTGGAVPEIEALGRAGSAPVLRTVLVGTMHSLRTGPSSCTGPAFRLLPMLAVAKLAQVTVSYGSSSD